MFERASYKFLHRHVTFLAFVTSLRRYMAQSNLNPPTVVSNFHLNKKAPAILGFPVSFTPPHQGFREAVTSLPPDVTMLILTHG